MSIFRLWLRLSRGATNERSVSKETAMLVVVEVKHYNLVSNYLIIIIITIIITIIIIIIIN